MHMALHRSSLSARQQAQHGVWQHNLQSEAASMANCMQDCLCCTSSGDVPLRTRKSHKEGVVEVGPSHQAAGVYHSAGRAIQQILRGA